MAESFGDVYDRVQKSYRDAGWVPDPRTGHYIYPKTVKELREGLEIEIQASRERKGIFG